VGTAWAGNPPLGQGLFGIGPKGDGMQIGVNVATTE
jgi:hypothetical protein